MANKTLPLIFYFVKKSQKISIPKRLLIMPDFKRTPPQTLKFSRYCEKITSIINGTQENTERIRTEKVNGVTLHTLPPCSENDIVPAFQKGEQHDPQ